MAGVLQKFLENSSPDQLLELLSRYLETPESKRDSDFYLSLKSVLITLNEHDKLSDDLVCRISHDLCLPVVRCGDSQANKHQIHIVYEVLALCCAVGPRYLVQEVASLCLESLSNHSNDITTPTGLPVVVCIDLISHLMKDDGRQVIGEDLQKEMFDKLLSVLYQSDDLMCMKITSSVLPLFLSLDTQEGLDKIQNIWRMIKEMSDSSHSISSDGHLKSCYSIMCGLADFLIAENDSKNLVLCDSQFWELIQQGLNIQDPLSSKRSMYLLKRALDHVDRHKLNIEVKTKENAVIFYWNPQQRKYWMDIWQEFVLLMESLDETQVHVVKPVLPRLSKIISASEIKQDGSQALDVSWLTTIIIKASLHPSKFLRKWAVMEVLTLDLSKSPLLLSTNWSFLLGHFQTMLNEYSIYGKDNDDDSGNTSPVGTALLPFYNLCLSFLPKEQHVDFLMKLLDSVEKQKFTPVPIVFFSYALSSIEGVSVLGPDALHKMRNILLSLRTHTSHIRLPTKGFILTAVTNLTDPHLLDWDAIYNFLAKGKLEECLSRGNWLWNCLCEWLWKIDSVKQAIRKTENALKDSQFKEGLFNFLEFKVQKYMNNPDVHEDFLNDDVEALGRLIIAVVDTLQMKQYASGKKYLNSPIIPILNQITQIFQDASTRLYMSQMKLSKTAALLTMMLQVLNSSDNHTSTLGLEGCHDYTTNLVSQSIKIALRDILNLVHRQLMTAQDDSLTGKTYLELCNSLYRFFAAHRSLNSNLTEFYKFIEDVALISIKTIQRLQTLKNYEHKEWILFQQSMVFVGWCCKIVSTKKEDFPASFSDQILHSIRSFQLNLEFKKPEIASRALNGENTANDAAKSNSSWRNSVSEFISALWTAVAFFLQNTKDTHEAERSAGVVVVTGQAKDVLGAALDALNITSNVLPIVKSIGLLFPTLLEVDVDCCSRALDVIWRTMRDLWEDVTFWENFPVFLSVIFSPVLLMLPDSHPLTMKIKCYLETLLTDGEIRAGVMHVVIQQLSNVWVNELKKECHSCLLVYQDTIIDLLLFGPMISKAKRIESHVEAYLRHLGNQSPLCALMSLDIRDDTQVRITMINVLLALDPAKPQTQDLLKSIIHSLILRDKEISGIQTVVYISSQYHRQKHRAWQTVLILLPLVLEHNTEGDDYAKEILQSVFASMLDQNQVSVQNFQLWVGLYILTRYPDLTNLLWLELLYDSDKRIGTVGLLVTMAMLFAVHCVPRENSDKRASFFSRAISAIFPWVTANHRTVRVTAQVAVQKMWYCCKSENLMTVLKDNAIIEACLSLIAAANDALAEKIRLLENSFFFDFDPIRDFSIETIYHTIPKQSGITEEEWIAPKEFQQSSLGQTLWTSSQCRGTPLYNKDLRLAYSETMYNNKEKIGPQFERRIRKETTPNSKLAQDDSEKKDKREANNAVLNVQKKMIAWKIVPPEDVVTAELQQQRMLALQKSSGGNLVVVASLIDRAPNLGGLCRTSEIFGVRKLVLGNNEITKDQDFKRLSVSSAKWIDIEQVRPIDLKGYLQDMRRQGYTLIGVEQTANSQPLTQYQFPHDALLLLGNEKKGIPADLIQLLDQCVEIPQVGIIRSLNVHVSGALLIWEYTRQRVLTTQNTAK